MARTKRVKPPAATPATDSLGRLLHGKINPCTRPPKTTLMRRWPTCWGCGSKLLGVCYVTVGCHHNLPKNRPAEPKDWYGLICEGCNDWSPRRPWSDR